jgi:peptidoglycan/xylan/chitin deacetylase (PgdA/CDA1 family)
VPSSNATIYLTFDDGPTPEITEWVINELGKHGAKATFFCLGKNVVTYPHIFQKLTSQGHRIGNHTYDHPNGWRTPLKKYIQNAAEGSKYIQSNLFRPPYGKITPQQIYSLKKKYRIVMWSILSGDYLQNLSIDATLREMKKEMKPGSIIVFHDSVKGAANLKRLLPEILLHGEKMGYRFEAMPNA